MADRNNILQDAPPTTGFKNLQSRVQTVRLPPPQSEPVTASTQCVALKTTTSPTILPTHGTGTLIIPSLTKPSVQCFTNLPASLTITSKPMPPIEFVSVNTPIKPLKSEIGSAPLIPQPSRLQVHPVSNPISSEIASATISSPLRLQIKSVSSLASDKRSETPLVNKQITSLRRVNNSNPLNVEIQKLYIPCKITKIDQSLSSTSLTPNISTSTSHISATTTTITTNISNNIDKKVDIGTQTMNEMITCATYLENIDLKTENSKLKAEIARLQKKIEVDLNQNRNIAKLFTENQMRKMRTPSTHISWVWKDICWAITLQAAGPRAYKHLYHKGFPIPHMKTLQRWIKNIKFESGILTPVIDILKDIAELQLDDRVCVLCFDEMELSPIDSVDASVALRQFVQIAIVRGLKSPWKQPIFYDFNCVMSKSVITKIISDLYAAGFVVVAMVAKLDSDQLLLDELEISIDKTWFEHPCDKTAKIFTFLDAPQLLNSIRNQFIDGGFVFDGKLITCYNVQEILLNHLNETKLNHVHLEIINLGREKIGMATRLFSKTTYKAILKYKTQDSIDSNNAIDCAAFVKLISEWFEIFSTTPCSVPTKKAFGLDLKNQMKTLENVDEVMTQNVILDTTPCLFSFQDGVLLTNKSLCDLYNYVKDNFEIEHMLTFRLNQDILETFFDDLRGDVPASQPLSRSEFQQNLRKYLFSRNVKHFRINFIALANGSDDTIYNNEHSDDNCEDTTKEDSTEDERTLSRFLIPNQFGKNNTLEDCLMDAGIEDLHENEEKYIDNEEKYIEDYVMSELILDDL